ncbi:MAG: hemerythrin domain-containing protein [Bryobacterales bacterium]|nr:hemerythrin domain-containing protein [Bryobacterales bacterium]
MSAIREKAAFPEVEIARWSASSLHDLIEHITSRHHAYLRSELPWMDRAIARAAEARGRAGASAQAPLSRTFRFFKRELELHLRKEEEVLFPLIRRLETAVHSGANPPRFSFGSIANPIGILREDHEGESRQIGRMLDWIGNYSGPPSTAHIFDPLFDRLQALDADMRLHVHLEDEILFPRVRLLEGES